MLESFFKCKVSINAYYSRGKSTGLEHHADPYHIFAIQVYGEKNWYIGNIPVKNVSEKHNPRVLETNKPTDTLSTKQGEVIYIPAGMIHSASTDIVSLHLAIGIVQPKIVDQMEVLLRKSANNHSILRSSLEFQYRNGGLIYKNPTNNLYEKAFEIVQDDLKNSSVYFTSNYSHADSFLSLPRNNNSYLNNNFSNDSTDKYSHLNHIIKDIWELSNCPVSLYLRGSHTSQKSKYKPWDTDIYLIIDKKESWYSNIFDICKWLDNRYKEIPPIDLNVITKHDIYANNEYLLKKLILFNDGILVKGKEIRKYVIYPKLNINTAYDVSNILGKIYKMKTTRLFYQYDTVNGLASPSLNELLSLVKLVLRFGMVKIIENEQKFTRSIDECSSSLINMYPSINKEVNALLNFLNHPSQIKETLELCESIYHTVYE